MLWLAVCIIFATFIAWKFLASLRRSLKKRNVIKKLPCPPGAHWLKGHQHLGPFDPGFKWLRDTVKAFPRIYTLWQGLDPLPVLVHPDTIKPLLTDSVPSVKPELYELFADLAGEGLVTSSGPKWKRNRRLLTHSFHLDVLLTYISVYNDCVEVLLGKMDKLAAEVKPMSVKHEFVLSSFDVILRTACSHESNIQLEIPPKKGELNIFSAYDTMTWFVQKRMFNNRFLAWLFQFRFLDTEYAKVNAFVSNFHTRLIEARQKEISEKIEGGNPITKPRDFLDTLLMARDADGRGLTSTEIKDEVKTFLFAGHETTATSLTWLCYFLVKYPEHQTKIRQEVDEILADRDADRITRKDIISMEYMTRFIKESMRMNNVGVQIPRKLTAPLTVEGVTLPVGTTVAVNIYQLHHNPAVWGDDHMEFKPSRFLPENASKMDPFAYLPFSAGSRNCIGQQFALNEIKIFLARILRRFRLSWVKGERDPVPSMSLTLKMQHDFTIALEPIYRKS